MNELFFILFVLTVAFVIGFITAWAYFKERWKKPFGHLQGEMLKIKAENSSLKSENTSLQNKLKEAEDKNGLLVKNMSELENKEKAHNNLDEEHEQEVQHYKLRYEASISEMDGMMEEIYRLREKMAEKDEIIREKPIVIFTDAKEEEKDDLKKILGIGAFIEKKLNNIGVYTYKQISEFDEELVERVTNAIEFFPGRIYRDNWIGQAKALMEQNGLVDHDTLLHMKNKHDDLKVISGIGPFIEKKLNKIGIISYKQISELDHDDVQKISQLIEFFPDRIYRENWIGQAQKLVKEQMANHA
ncbi:helix-hairpin-helix domain-containing protein [Flexithrix dorotheae]|uniref:helix-hairpin-helix domain-containing protein n=1 Tax=Flexithrix dorotheae TaxID=70993 RepID=UPI000367AB90|nr:hypothetical protein [Flexithrix dorotheae]